MTWTHIPDGCHGFEAELDVEAIEPIEIDTFYGGGGAYGWALEGFKITSGSRTHATREDAKAAAVDHLQRMRERIDLTLAELEQEARDARR